jgi:hypothetical protein
MCRAGESAAEAGTGFLIRYGSATTSSAASLIASCAPSRSVIAPRGAGTVTLLTCWVAAARSSDPARTEPRYTARASAIPSRDTNAMKRIPMRRSRSAKARYPPPLCWVESEGWIAAAPVAGTLDACDVVGAWVACGVVAGACCAVVSVGVAVVVAVVDVALVLW